MTGEVVSRRWEVAFSFNEEDVAEMLKGHDYFEHATQADIDHAARVAAISMEVNDDVRDVFARQLNGFLTIAVHARIHREKLRGDPQG